MATHICMYIYRVGSRGDVILSGDYILEDHCVFKNQDGMLCVPVGCEYENL